MSFDPWEVMLGPIADGVKGADQGAAERGKGVLDHGRDDGVNLADDDAVLLEGAEGLGEHLLGDAGDLALEFVVTAGADSEAADEERRPFATDAGKQIARGATGIEYAGAWWHPV